jgi:hypothetical protein
MLGVAHATTIVPPEFATLVNDSDYVVRAVTRRVTAVQQPGLHGGRIFTRVELEVLEPIAGTPPASVTLELLGGRMGDRQLTVEGMPVFKVGDEDVLFVSGNGHTICPLYAMGHGRYPVRTDAASGRKFVTRADGSPLEGAADIRRPLGETSGPTRAPVAVTAALTPADFARQIRTAVQPGARITREQ